jgi:hypothetical protein
VVRSRRRRGDGSGCVLPPDPYRPPDTPVGKINLTDPDSRLVEGVRGHLQGYNAQAATTEDQIVIAAEVTVDTGIQVLIPPDSGTRKGTRPGWDGGAYAFMRRVLSTEHGGELYGRRKRMIEPVFGDMKFNRRLERFGRRGRSAARAEWRLITATHNLLKVWRHTIAPAAA